MLRPERVVGTLQFPKGDDLRLRTKRFRQIRADAAEGNLRSERASSTSGGRDGGVAILKTGHPMRKYLLLASLPMPLPAAAQSQNWLIRS